MQTPPPPPHPLGTRPERVPGGATSPSRWEEAYGLVLAVFLASLSFGMLQLSLPLNLRAAGVSAPVIGVVLSMFGVGFLVFELGWGVIVDRFGSALTMAVAMAGMTAAIAGFAFVDGALAFSVLCLLAAGMLDASGPGGRSFLAGALPADKLGAGLGALTGAWSLGIAIGAPVAGFMIDRYGLRSVFYLAPVFPLAATVIVLLAFRRARWGHANVARQVTATGAAAAWRLPIRPLLAPSAVIMVLLVGSGAEGAFLPLLVTGPLHADAAQAGIAAAVVGGLGGLLMVPGGRLGDAYGRRLAIGAGIVLSAAGLAGYAIAAAYAAVLGSAVLRAAGSALAWPAVTAALADEAPPESRGLAMAIFGEFESVGLALGPLLAGLVAGSLGLGAAFAVTAAVAMAGLLALPLAVGRRPSRRNSAAIPGESRDALP